MQPLLVLIGLVAGLVLGAIGARYFFRGRGEADLRQAQMTADRALSNAESQAKEIVLTAKEEAHRIRTTAEDELRERQTELLQLEQRAQQREDHFLRRLDELEKRQEELRVTEGRQQQQAAIR